MRIIRRTFSNLSGSTLLLGKAGENLATKLELDISRELNEFPEASFELILKMPASSDPYPVLVDIVGNKLTYLFNGSDLSESGTGQLEALVLSASGEVLKSTTARTRIQPSIIPNTYPGPIQKVIDDLREEIGEIAAKSAIKVVETLPTNPDKDMIVYQRSTGLYWFTGTDWVQLTDDFASIGELDEAIQSLVNEIEAVRDDLPTAQEISRWNDSADIVMPPDDVTPLSFRAYDSLSLRDDFEDIGSLDDVPIYITEHVGYGIGLYADANDPSNHDSVSVGEVWDDVDGLPVRFIRAVLNGTGYARWSRDCTVDGHTFLRGVWYTNNVQTTAPSFAGFHPTALEVCGDWYDDLSDLPEKAASALRSLSQLVNVSDAAMGTITVPENAVQRLTGSPKAGMHYAYFAHDDLTLPLPSVVWTGASREFWLDLDCASSINLTFSDEVRFANGNNIDTTRGRHRLHFYVFDGDDKWTVAEEESVDEITEDVVPEYVIPFRNISADQLRAVLKYGYGNGNGAWCVRKNGVVLEFFHVGDTRSVTLTDGREVTMRIIDIEHDDLSSGGKAALTCDFKELVSVPSFRTAQNYAGSDLQNAERGIVQIIPEWIKELIPDVVKGFSVEGATVIDKTWAFSSVEVGLSVKSGVENVGTVYPVFTNNASRMRMDQNNNYQKWPLRTKMSMSNSSANSFDSISSTGEYASAFITHAFTEIAVGFCLNV